MSETYEKALMNSLTLRTLWPLPIWWTGADELTGSVRQLTDSIIQTWLVFTPVVYNKHEKFQSRI